MNKRSLRTEFLYKRQQLTEEERNSGSEEMLRQLEEFGFHSMSYLLSYHPLADRNEFDVTDAGTILMQTNKKLQIALPVISADNVNMEGHLFGPGITLVRNIYNIPEPLDGKKIEPELFDMVIVPLLAFDQEGFRVGYGKGFYDRYLARCRPDAIKIGFSYFEAVERITDINEFDVPLDYCITPMRMYEF